MIIADDENEWVSSIKTLFEDKHLRSTLGAESKRLFDEKYNYSSQYEKLKTALLGENEYSFG